jgi:hypothetical protein
VRAVRAAGRRAGLGHRPRAAAHARTLGVFCVVPGARQPAVAAATGHVGRSTSIRFFCRTVRAAVHLVLPGPDPLAGSRGAGRRAVSGARRLGLRPERYELVLRRRLANHLDSALCRGPGGRRRRMVPGISHSPNRVGGTRLQRYHDAVRFEGYAAVDAGPDAGAADPEVDVAAELLPSVVGRYGPGDGDRRSVDGPRPF